MYARVGQEIGEHLVGGYVYYGRARAETETLGHFSGFIRKPVVDSSELLSLIQSLVLKER